MIIPTIYPGGDFPLKPHEQEVIKSPKTSGDKPDIFEFKIGKRNQPMLSEGKPIEQKDIRIKIEDIPKDENGYPLFNPADYPIE